MRTLLLLGAGLAAYGVARFARSAIAEERNRRDHDGTQHEIKRWEDEGGSAMSPQTRLVTPSGTPLHSAGEPVM
jgi:hypothetical protein